MTLGSQHGEMMGVDFDLISSPYDMPDAVRADRPKRGKLKIEFRYIDGEEPTMTREMGDCIVLHVGRYTSRIRAIDIDVASLRIDAIGLNLGVAEQALSNALGQITSQVSGAPNTPFVRQAVEGRKKDLLASLGA